jgi:spermidine synthase
MLIGLAAAAALLLVLVPEATSPVARSGGAARLSLAARFVGAAAVTSLAVVFAWSVKPAPWGLIAYGRYMATYAHRFAPAHFGKKGAPTDFNNPDIFCTYVGEGLNGSVAVTDWASGVRNFHSAGKVQASTDPNDMRLQRMLGHLSALAHPAPQSVLVVACGAGVTAGTFVLHPSIQRIVICDIEPLVPKRVTPLFETENYGVLKDPRTEVIYDDGRHYIRTTQEKFDIITSDPIDPWVKGCAALNTVEYYEMCKAHLKPGGVMSLWIPLYECNSAAAKSLIATFFKVFPNGILWSNDAEGEGYDAVLFGQVEPTRIDLDQWHERLARQDHARVRQSLRDVQFNSVISLLSTYAGHAAELQPWLHDAQLNTDANLRLQYLAGMWLNSYEGSRIMAQIRRYRQFPEQLFVGSETRTKMLRLALGGRPPSAE